MKPKASDIPRLAKALPPGITLVLAYGPDEGLVQDYARSVSLQIVDDLTDPFNVVRLDGDAVAQNPALLADEARALSMMGGKRLVRVDKATDRISTIINDLVDQPNDSSLVLLVAGDLTARSTLRKSVEQSDHGVALAAYADDAGSLRRLIQSSLNQAGLSITPDAESLLQDRLGADRGISNSELEKLVLFKKADPEPINVDDIEAIVGDGSALILQKLAASVTAGRTADVDRAVERAFIAGENGVSILRAVQARIIRLLEASLLRDQGTVAAAAIGALKPPVFFKDRESMTIDLKNWPTRRLTQALDQIIEAEIETKSTGSMPELICSRVCLRLAASVRRGHI